MTSTYAVRQIASATRSLLKGAGAQLAGKERGRDRRVHRLSFDADQDPRAKPWRPVGDGSTRQGLVFREALLQAAREDYQQGWEESPLGQVREARRGLVALSAELDAMAADPHGRSPGRQAAIRIELAKLKAVLDRATERLRRIDVDVLEAVMAPICFVTGKLFPSHDWIARRAGCHRNSVINALRRLKARGFLNWVRRSVATGARDVFAPQREQTSNAYFFEHRQRMQSRLWQRFTQILAAKLRRLGCVPAGVDAGAPVLDPASPLGSAIASLGAALGADAPPHEARAH